MNWDDLADEYCILQSCSEAEIFSYSLAEGENSGTVRSLRKNRRDIQKATQAVRKAYESNPNAPRDEMRKTAYKFFVGGVILSILLSALMSVLAKMAIEWLLDKILNKDASSGPISLPPK